ncbi:GDSL lipase/esterase [Chytriomyces cf. hyalinus JEL632]|nr:GDSL lipase/esterase [Chytriomyces cf. hyalinus JEL632]
MSLAAGPTPARFDALVAFGDSFSDTHNLFDLYGLPKPPYFNGRYSNGPVWIEYLSAQLSVANTYNFAYAGSSADNADSLTPLLEMTGASKIFDFRTPDLTEQLELYNSKSLVLNSTTTLFTVFSGANDFVFSSVQGRIPKPDVVADYVTDFTASLIEASNATTIVILNMPPIQFTPVGRLFSVAQNVVASLVTKYNEALAEGVNRTSKKYPSANITVVDLHKMMNTAMSPEGRTLFNLTNTAEMCFNQLLQSTCSNPDNYLFWDFLHPTTRGHELVAKVAFDALFRTSFADTKNSSLPTAQSTEVATKSGSTIVTWMFAVLITLVFMC